MPFIPHTPESLVRRSDSKNPATTCKGITTGGTHCRRSLASPQSSPSLKRGSKNGVLAVIDPDDEEHDGAAAYFCWQHKGQATTLAAADQFGRMTNIVPLQKRTSIDILAEQLGILEVDDTETPQRHKGRRQHTRSARKETLPRAWQEVEGPLLAVPETRHRAVEKAVRKAQQQKRHRRPNLFSIFCCGTPSDLDPTPPIRTRRDPEKSHQRYTENAHLPPPTSTSHAPKNRESGRSSTQRPNHPARAHSTPTFTSKQHSHARPDPRTSRTTSHTQSLLSLIPPTLSPQTTSLLLAELAKPLSPHDEEGFIYIFWLTDGTREPPDVETASSLIADDVGTASPKTTSTTLLKIGRASNVQRRLNEWTRQCGHNLSLIRCYPYPARSIPRTATNSCAASPSRIIPPPASSPLKVPHAHRVERLIHLELADKRVKKACESCGKEHREWFQVEGTRGGVRAVDEVVRRWVGWGERAVQEAGV